MCKHQLSSAEAEAEYRMSFLKVLDSKQSGAMRADRQIQAETGQLKRIRFASAVGSFDTANNRIFVLKQQKKSNNKTREKMSTDHISAANVIDKKESHLQCA